MLKQQELRSRTRDLDKQPFETRLDVYEELLIEAGLSERLRDVVYTLFRCETVAIHREAEERAKREYEASSKHDRLIF
jgi:hypothetical protein